MCPVELKQDSLNVIDLHDIGVSMQAVEDKIIILVDGYKSGYECDECKGTGRVQSTIAEGMIRSCDKCKGSGQTLHIPDTAKSLPSTGVIVSMGPKTEFMLLKAMLKHGAMDQEQFDEDAKDILIQIGTRVVFGTHVGTKVPLRGEIKLVIMREKEPLCVVFGTLDEKQLLDYTADIT